MPTFQKYVRFLLNQDLNHIEFSFYIEQSVYIVFGLIFMNAIWDNKIYLLINYIRYLTKI